MGGCEARTWNEAFIDEVWSGVRGDLGPKWTREPGTEVLGQLIAHCGVDPFWIEGSVKDLLRDVLQPEALKEHGLTLTDVARLSKISRETLNRWRKEKQPGRPTAGSLFAVLGVLGWRIEFLPEMTDAAADADAENSRSNEQQRLLEDSPRSADASEDMPSAGEGAPPCSEITSFERCDVTLECCDVTLDECSDVTSSDPAEEAARGGSQSTHSEARRREVDAAANRLVPAVEELVSWFFGYTPLDAREKKSEDSGLTGPSISYSSEASSAGREDAGFGGVGVRYDDDNGVPLVWKDQVGIFIPKGQRSSLDSSPRLAHELGGGLNLGMVIREVIGLHLQSRAEDRDAQRQLVAQMSRMEENRHADLVRLEEQRHADLVRLETRRQEDARRIDERLLHLQEQHERNRVQERARSDQQVEAISLLVANLQATQKLLIEKQQAAPGGLKITLETVRDFVGKVMDGMKGNKAEGEGNG